MRLYALMSVCFGREFQLGVNSPHETAHFLRMKLSGFHQFLRDANSSGIGFAVLIGSRTFAKTTLTPLGNDDFTDCSYHGGRRTDWPVVSDTEGGSSLPLLSAAAS